MKLPKFVEYLQNVEMHFQFVYKTVRSSLQRDIAGNRKCQRYFNMQQSKISRLIERSIPSSIIDQQERDRKENLDSSSYVSMQS